LVKESVKEIRTLSYLLHPPLLEEHGLVSALSWYLEGFTRRSVIHVDVDVPPELGRLPAEVELTLFRIVQGKVSATFIATQGVRRLISG
jgi:signal transduction histidine kinase